MDEFHFVAALSVDSILRGMDWVGTMGDWVVAVPARDWVVLEAVVQPVDSWTWIWVWVSPWKSQVNLVCPKSMTELAGVEK